MMSARLTFCLVVPLACFHALACGDDPISPRASDVASIDVTPATDTLVAIDGTVQLEAVARDAEGKELAGISFSWTSSDPDRVSVGSATGLATAMQGGIATVTASAGSASGGSEIHVIQETRAVEVIPDTWDPDRIGRRRQLQATARDANDHPIPDPRDFTWDSSSPEVVAVDANGVATALSDGNAQISATHDGISGSTDVSVTDGGPGSTPAGVVYTVWFARSDRTGAFLQDGNLRTPKIDAYGTGSPITPWPHGNVSGFQWEGNRIGILADVVGGSGTLHVRDRGENWERLAVGDTRDFHLAGSRITILTGGGVLRYQGGIDGNRRVVKNGEVEEFRYVANEFGGGVAWVWLDSDGRVGVHQMEQASELQWTAYDPSNARADDASAGDGDATDEEGPEVRQFEASWVERQNCTDLDCSVLRVAILLEDGSVRVRDGIGGGWTTVTENAVEFRMSSRRIMVHHENDALRVESQSQLYFDTWRPLATGPFVDFDLEGFRMAVLREDGGLFAKDGDADPWTTLATDIRAFELQGEYIGAVDNGGTLHVKEGLEGSWASADGSFAGSITQIQPNVEVPVPPHRTTPSSYEQNQASCEADSGGVDCVTPIEVAHFPVPWYGRFCGGGRPTDGDPDTDDDFDVAVDRGAIDGLDQSCLHHDLSGSWYSEASGPLNWGDGAACIVRYALRHSRLTQDGVVLTHGADNVVSWDSAWGDMMPRLKQGLDVYFSVVRDRCGPVRLDNFTQATAWF